jgi:hypothetical protein
MKGRRTDRQETFSPLRDKTLSSVLCQLFVQEFGYGNKVPFAQVMIERILETIDSFVRPTAHLRPGQLLWMAVAYDGRKHAMKAMQQIPQVPVILDLVTDEELQELADGEKWAVVRRHRHARLLKQAFEQGGVLAQSDLAAISLRHHATIQHDIADVQNGHQCLLPYRGAIQDVGPTLTHKVQVASLLEAGHLEPEICRLLSPVHDLKSVERYAQTYKNVLKLVDRGLAPNEISCILQIGMRLVSAYIDIVNEHHPELLAQNPHLRAWPEFST